MQIETAEINHEEYSQRNFGFRMQFLLRQEHKKCISKSSYLSFRTVLGLLKVSFSACLAYFVGQKEPKILHLVAIMKS